MKTEPRNQTKSGNVSWENGGNANQRIFEIFHERGTLVDK